MKSLQADFFKVMKEGAIQYAAPLPFLDLVCVGTATQTEVEEQVDLMYSLIHQQVDAIVLVPIDSKALVQPVVEAVRKGVPVINIDIRLDTQLLEQKWLLWDRIILQLRMKWVNYWIRSCGMKIKLLLLKDWRQPIMRSSVKEVLSRR